MNLRDPFYSSVGQDHFQWLSNTLLAKMFPWHDPMSLQLCCLARNEFWHRVVLKTEAAMKECHN